MGGAGGGGGGVGGRKGEQLLDSIPLCADPSLNHRGLLMSPLKGHNIVSRRGSVWSVYTRPPCCSPPTPVLHLGFCESTLHNGIAKRSHPRSAFVSVYSSPGRLVLLPTRYLSNLTSEVQFTWYYILFDSGTAGDDVTVRDSPEPLSTSITVVYLFYDF